MESDRLGNALVELETQGIAYGDLALTIALHGDLTHIERLDGDILRIFAAHDAKAIREGYGQLPAWFCRLPAQPRKRQVRSVFVSAGAAACLAPIYGPPTGEARSPHLDRAALAILETQWQTPFYYDLFHGDVGHTLVLGATGAGKSFTLNFLLVQALQYNPRVLILDLGGSYRWITRFLGGGYLELSPDDDTGQGGFRLRPFALPHTERSVQFLTGWIMRLLRIGGWTVSGADPTEIRARIEDLYAFPPARRTMTVFVQSLPSAMWPAMGRWYGSVNRPGFLRGSIVWEDGVHGKTKEVLTGGPGAGGSVGVRPRAPARLAVGGDPVGGREDRVHVRDAAPLGAAGRA